MRFLLVALLCAISYAQTEWKNVPKSNHGFLYNPYRYNSYQNPRYYNNYGYGANSYNSRVSRNRQTTSGSNSNSNAPNIPWGTIKDFVNKMADQNTNNEPGQPAQPQQPANPRYVGEPGENEYAYQYYPQNMWPNQPEQPNGGDGFAGDSGPWAPGSSSGSDWSPSGNPFAPSSPQSNPPPSWGNGGAPGGYPPQQGSQPAWNSPSQGSPESEGSPASPKPQGAPAGLLTTPCGVNPTPWECQQEESCTWTENAQYKACVGEGTPCEFLPGMGICSQMAQIGDSACTWDMQGRFCYGETTPCHRLYTQQTCTASGSECEWSMEAQACWSETTPCPELRKPMLCGMNEDCHWDMMSRSCMMGEAPELMATHAIANSTSSLSHSHRVLVLLFGLVLGVLSGLAVWFFKSKTTAPQVKNVYQKASAWTNVRTTEKNSIAENQSNWKSPCTSIWLYFNYCPPFLHHMLILTIFWCKWFFQKFCWNVEMTCVFLRRFDD